MQLAHQFLLAELSNAVPMPAGCQGRARRVPYVALNRFALPVPREIPAFIPAMRGRPAEAAE
jgi:hypothetical protein